MIRISYIIVAMLTLSLSACAQSNKWKTVINKNNGEKLAIPCENIDSITFVNNDDIELSNKKVEVKKIYGDGSTYCAFTSLIKREGTYYLAFREASTHVSPGDYGIIRVLSSNDGDVWNLKQTIKADEIDLRDPDLSVMPDGRLMIVCGARMMVNNAYVTRTYVSFEQGDGFFCTPFPAKIPEEAMSAQCSWLWRLSWYEGVGYGVCYGGDKLILLKTIDGINFDTVSPITINGQPSECQMKFKKDGSAIMLVRRDEGGKTKGYMGQSEYPYSNWTWKELEIYLAGEDFLIDNNRLVVATRMTQNIGQRTAVWFGDFDGNFNWCYTLPYGGLISNMGDTAYAGMLSENGEYWISYYAIYEGEKPCIFMVKLPKNLIAY